MLVNLIMITDLVLQTRKVAVYLSLLREKELRKNNTHGGFFAFTK